MKVAVLSDSHDHLGNLQAAAGQLPGLGAEALLFLGDFCAPFSLKLLADSFSAGPIHAVFGNNDGDPYLLSQVAAGLVHVHLHGHYAELDLDSRKVALFHYPDVAERIAQSGQLDAVFSGHDHRHYVHEIGPTLWANPGEIMGRFGRPSFGIYDTRDHRFVHHFL